MDIRSCGASDKPAILSIINAAAQKYRGVIPDDRWHEPYMSSGELDRELESGVEFWGCTLEGRLAGVMGIQPKHDVVLIRHAYVQPANQGSGVGGVLLGFLRARVSGRMLVGTWATAAWAIGFYERRGFALVGKDAIAPLLGRYWSIPDRQIETSVVLADPPFG